MLYELAKERLDCHINCDNVDRYTGIRCNLFCVHFHWYIKKNFDLCTREFAYPGLAVNNNKYVAAIFLCYNGQSKNLLAHRKGLPWGTVLDVMFNALITILIDTSSRVRKCIASEYSMLFSKVGEFEWKHVRKRVFSEIYADFVSQYLLFRA